MSWVELTAWVRNESSLLSFGLAAWGAAISTALAALRIGSAWRQRTRITTSYVFGDGEQYVNTIIIENPGPTPVMIAYWELYWSETKRFKRIVTDPIYPDNGYNAIKIGPHSTYSLTFAGDQYFEWASTVKGRACLYLKLHLVGKRRPKVLRVYGP